MALETLFSQYQRLLVFDTETTGLQCARDEIIEFAAVGLELRGGAVETVLEYDQLAALSPGGFVPDQIQKLTGISTQTLRERGLPKTRICRDIAAMLTESTLLLAYNAHFDLSFLFYTLLRHGDPAILKGRDKLDLLTVYRDRRPYPHKLLNAIGAYGLEGQVQNSHRALDDVWATVAVMKAMDREKEDLLRYVNLFGYNPRYGLSGKPIGSITYRPQFGGTPLYEAAAEQV